MPPLRVRLLGGCDPDLIVAVEPPIVVRDDRHIAAIGGRCAPVGRVRIPRRIERPIPKLGLGGQHAGAEKQQATCTRNAQTALPTWLAIVAAMQAQWKLARWQGLDPIDVFELKGPIRYQILFEEWSQFGLTIH